MKTLEDIAAAFGDKVVLVEEGDFEGEEKALGNGSELGTEHVELAGKRGV